MERILVTIHPINGAQAQPYPTLEEAQEAAKKFATEHYSNLEVGGLSVLDAWWLTENGKLPLQPWPIAVILERSVLDAAVDGAPTGLLFFCPSPIRFDMMVSSDKEKTRNLILNMIQPYGGWADDNEFGGVTFQWNDGEKDIIVGYLIAL